MPDSSIANLTDGTTAVSTDRIPVERSPFGAGTNRYITPGYIATLVDAAGEAAAAVATHEAAGNPHPTYLTQAEGDAAYEALGAVAAHAAAGDPHTGYALESALGTMSTQNANNVSVTGGAVSDVDLNLKDETVAADGDIAYNATTEELNYHNGQRALTDEVGWTPFAVPLWHTGGGTNQITLAARSGSDAGALAIPIHITGHMLLDGLFIRSQVASTARSAEWRIYRQRLNNGNAGENTLDFVTGTDGTFSYTPTVASNEYSALASAAYLAPGAYWLVIRNSHATSTFILGAAAAPVLATNLYQTKSIPALGATLDFVSATWTKGQSVMNLMLKGRVFGETTVF